jgi:DNA-binding PadR family transcriptional regulator
MPGALTVSSRPHSSRDLLALTILALLTEQPRHPYEVQRLIRERHKDFANGKPRALYHAVDQLLQTGAIEPVETSREGRRPERTVYRITDEGREEFLVWLHDLIEHPLSEFPSFTAAVSFLGYFPVETVIDALQGRVVALTSQVAGLDGALRVLREQVHMPRLWVLEHEYTRAMRQAELDWVQALIDDLKSGRLTWDFPKEWMTDVKRE